MEIRRHDHTREWPLTFAGPERQPSGTRDASRRDRRRQLSEDHSAMVHGECLCATGGWILRQCGARQYHRPGTRAVRHGGLQGHSGQRTRPHAVAHRVLQRFQSHELQQSEHYGGCRRLRQHHQCQGPAHGRDGAEADVLELLRARGITLSMLKTIWGISSVSLSLCLFVATACAQAQVTLRVDTLNPGVPIAHDFAGLSFEITDLFADKDGTYQFSGDNKQLVALFRVIGIRNLRVGGSTADRPEYGVPGRTEIDHLFGFAKAADVKIIYTFRLLNGNPAQAADLARYIRQHYSANLSCFQIGNEPDWDSYHTLPGHPRDPKIVQTDPTIPGSAYPSYLSDWKEYATAIIKAVPDACLSGPDTASNFPVPGTKDTDYNNESWTEHFAHDAKGMNVKFVTHHDYPGQSAIGV